MTISNKILDELLSGVDRPDDLLGDTGLMKELKVHPDQSVKVHRPYGGGFFRHNFAQS